jgi:hypothetical protein
MNTTMYYCAPYAELVKVETEKCFKAERKIKSLIHHHKRKRNAP